MQAPLAAGASVERGVAVVVRRDHRNLEAGRGCAGSACFALVILEARSCESRDASKRSMSLP